MAGVWPCGSLSPLALMIACSMYRVGGLAFNQREKLSSGELGENV